MDISFLDSALPILVIAVGAGLVIGLVVFVLASRRASRDANPAADPATGPATHPATPGDRAPGFDPAMAQPAPRPTQATPRSLSRDTRQRATNLIEDIARHYNDRHTG